MNENAELPRMSEYLTVKEIAETLVISPRMVHTYIQSGRLPGYKIGNITVVSKEAFQTFQRAKKGRPRTQVPVWRKSVGENFQYLTIMTAHMKPGQNSKLEKKLEEFHTAGTYLMPGTVGRYIVQGVQNPEEVQVVLVWRSTVMPKAEVRIETIKALKNELADVLSWDTSRDVYGRVLLHSS